MSDQTVWFFDRPTIMYCSKHQTVDFFYAENTGLRCSQRGCTEDMWTEFVAEDVGDFAFAEDRAKEHGPLSLDMTYTHKKINEEDPCES